MNASLIGADLSGHGVVSLGMVDGLSVSRRRLWQSARQRRVRRVIAQPGAVTPAVLSVPPKRRGAFFGIGCPAQSMVYSLDG
jgi:hypothetical protein